jgi:hypothetical protein
MNDMQMVAWGGVHAELMTLAMMTSRSRTAPYLLRAPARHKMKEPSTGELMT